MKHPLPRLMLVVWLVFAGFAWSGNSEAGGGEIVLTSTPTALATGNGNPSNKVNSVEFRAFPSHTCKAYVGVAGMNTATGANVLAAIYPNANGGWSDRYKIQDPRSGDGIDVTTLRVMGDCPGEKIVWAWYQTGTQLATLTPIVKGLRGAGQVATFGGIATANLIEFRVWPGYVGKVRAQSVFYGYPTLAVLFPNTGNAGQNNANTESFEIVDRSHKLLASGFAVAPEIAGEGAIVNVWRDSSQP